MELTLAIAALKVVGYGLAAIGPGIGIGIATYGLCVSAARQPEMKGQLMGYFFIGAAMSEALALLGLVLLTVLYVCTRNLGCILAGIRIYHSVFFLHRHGYPPSLIKRKQFWVAPVLKA